MIRILATVTSLLLMLAIQGCTEPPANVFQGYVEGEYVLISSPLAGTLDQLSVARGDSVSTGAPLFALEREFEKAAVNEARHALQQAQNNLANLEKGSRPSEIESILARLRKAKASAALAKIEYERREQLIKANTISQEELDRARSDYEQKEQAVREINAELTTARLGARSDEIRAAMAQVLQSEARLDQANWSFTQKAQAAPADGLVFDTLFRVGELVKAGQPVVSLLPPDNIEIRFFVPQTLVGSVSLDQKALVSVDGVDGQIEATITFISPNAEYTPPVIYSSESRAKLVFMLRAKPDAAPARLHPGQPVDVTLPNLAP